MPMPLLEHHFIRKTSGICSSAPLPFFFSIGLSRRRRRRPCPVVVSFVPCQMTLAVAAAFDLWSLADGHR